MKSRHLTSQILMAMNLIYQALEWEACGHGLFIILLCTSLKYEGHLLIFTLSTNLGTVDKYFV